MSSLAVSTFSINDYCSKLARSHAEHLKDQGFNEHVLALAEENEAHSDDELAPPVGSNTTPGEPIYHIKQKDGRAQKVTNFFQTIDVQRRLKARRRGRHQKFAIMLLFFILFTC